MTRRDETGATMVEAAIASTIVLFLFLAVLQAGFFMRTYIAASDGSSAGARAGSVAADATTADYDIMKSISLSIATASHDHIKKIVVFRATAPNYTVPAGCLTGPVAGVCNVYDASDLSRPESSFDAAGGSGRSTSWRSTSRSVRLDPGTDHIGVYVEVKTGTGGWLKPTVAKQSVARIEPSTVS